MIEIIEIVAEASCNHAGHKFNAFELVSAAQDNKCDTVKFQYFEPQDMVSRDSTYLWQGKLISLFELYNKVRTPREWFPELVKFAHFIGIKFQVSLFNPKDVPYFKQIGVDSFKIASPEANWTELTDACASSGLPMSISLGCSSYGNALDLMKRYKGCDLTLMYCVSKYPPLPEECNMETVRHLCESILPGMKVGLSNHYQDDTTDVVAAVLGATVFEKHIMLPGVVTEDFNFSIEPMDFLYLRKKLELAIKSIGTATYGNTNHPLKRKEIEGRVLRK